MKTLHLAGKVTYTPPPPTNWGKYSTTNIGQIAIYLFIIETQKHSCDGCVIRNSLWPITTEITAVTIMNTPEWLSMQSLPVSLLAQLSVGPCDHLRLGASLVMQQGCSSWLWIFQPAHEVYENKVHNSKLHGKLNLTVQTLTHLICNIQRTALTCKSGPCCDINLVVK